MAWKTSLLILACINACLAEDFVRKAQEALRRAAQGRHTSFYAQSSPSAIAQIRQPVTNDNLQPYQESLAKIEAGDTQIDNILDHPSSPPPINQPLRHRIILAYTIHYVAEALAVLCGPDYDKDYNKLIDTAITKALTSPVEAVQEIQHKKAKLESFVKPTAVLIHELCDTSSRDQVNMCDLLVSWSIIRNPGKYRNPADSIVHLAKAYDSLKALEHEMKDATDDFTEIAYIIHGKDKLRDAILNLSHVYMYVAGPSARAKCH